MKFFKQWGRFMMLGARAHARWELDVSNTILGSRKRLVVLGLLTLPIVLGGFVFADQLAEVTDVMPEILGGHKA